MLMEHVIGSRYSYELFVFTLLRSYDLEQINVTRKGLNGYPSEANANSTDVIAGDNKYDYIPGILLPMSLCFLVCVCASVCCRRETCHFKAWMK